MSGHLRGMFLTDESFLRWVPFGVSTSVFYSAVVGHSERSERDQQQTETWIPQLPTSTALLLVANKFAWVSRIILGFIAQTYLNTNKGEMDELFLVLTYKSSLNRHGSFASLRMTKRLLKMTKLYCYGWQKNLCHSERVSEANAVKGYPPGHPCKWQRNLHCELLKMFWKTKAVSTNMDPSLRSGWQKRVTCSKLSRTSPNPPPTLRSGWQKRKDYKKDGW